MIVHPHGGASRRPGTYFVAEIKDSEKAARLIPFIFSTSQAYIIEAGDEYMRFYMDGGQIESAPDTPYEIATPYTEDQLTAIKHIQSYDTMYMVHPAVAQQKLTRTDHTTWLMAEIDFTDGPYEDAVEDNGITPSAVTGSITLTADDNMFAETDVNRLIRLQCDDTNWYWLKITAYTSEKVVTATVMGSDLPNVNKNTVYRLGSWCEELGYPSANTFYEQRYVLAGSPERPQTIWGSKSNASYEDFTPGSDDTAAWTHPVDGEQANCIHWLANARNLLCGTAGGILSVRSGAEDTPITPTAVKAKLEINHKSYDLQPAFIGSAILFLQLHGRKIREMKYQYVNDGYADPDITIAAEHMTEGGIVDWAYQAEPDSVLWCVRSDGTLIGLTYDRDQEVLAWHRHETDGQVESIAVIPADGYDQLWMIVKRTVNGTDKRFIEYLMPDFGTDVTDAFFIDCGLTRDDDGTPVSSVCGLDHLEGETVQILADGAVRPSQTVTDGAVTISPEAGTIHAGLGYTSVLEPMRLDAGAQAGTAQGKKKRINALTVRFYRTVGAKIGPDEDRMDTISFRTPADLMDSAVALFSGDKTVSFPGGWDTDGYIRIEQDQPLPMTVLSIMPVVSTSD
jgi:hypothetical protein